MLSTIVQRLQGPMSKAAKADQAASAAGVFLCGSAWSNGVGTGSRRLPPRARKTKRALRRLGRPVFAAGDPGPNGSSSRPSGAGAPGALRLVRDAAEELADALDRQAGRADISPRVGVASRHPGADQRDRPRPGGRSGLQYPDPSGNPGGRAPRLSASRRVPALSFRLPARRRGAGRCGPATRRYTGRNRHSSCEASAPPTRALTKSSVCRWYLVDAADAQPARTYPGSSPRTAYVLCRTSRQCPGGPGAGSAPRRQASSTPRQWDDVFPRTAVQRRPCDSRAFPAARMCGPCGRSKPLVAGLARPICACRVRRNGCIRSMPRHGRLAPARCVPASAMGWTSANPTPARRPASRRRQ